MVQIPRPDFFDIKFYIKSIIIVVLTVFLQNSVQKLWKAYNTKSFAFTVDTNYLDWNTTFPAISICEIFNGEKMWDLNEEYFGSDRDKFQDDLVADIAFFNGLCTSCKSCIQQMRPECRGNFSSIVHQFRTKCEKLISNCAWNGENFTCCDAFLPLQTEFGQCFTINSAHTDPARRKRLISNRVTGPGTLNIFALEDVQIHLHSPAGVPYINTEHDLQETILWGLQKEIVFNTAEIFNDANLKQQHISQRRCKFSLEFASDEQVKLYQTYSYSTCVTTCVAVAQISICKCTHHLMPRNQLNNTEICTIEGLSCLAENFETLTEIRRSCKCFASCEEPEYNIVYSSNDFFGEDLGSPITIKMASLPTTRYIRHTVRTTMDFIISVGGICSLLFGASIMSIIEYLEYGIVLLWKFFRLHSSAV